MANTSLSDHVMVFAGALSAEHCQALIDRFESSSDHESCQLEAGYSFLQLNVTQKWPDQNEILVPIFLSYFNRYQALVNARFWPPDFASSSCG